ncbi:MAG TPA: DUF2752 domain-containing protein [Flavobacterium sp.]
MDIEKYMLPCTNKMIFGLDCPGCGTQRAFLMVLKGDFLGAFHMFPAIYTTIVLFAAIALHFVDKSRKYHTVIISFAIVNAVIMITSYIYKITNIN